MHAYALAQAAGDTTSHTGWIVGYTIGIVIVLVVVALVVPILLLARSIGNEAPKINAALTRRCTTPRRSARFAPRSSTPRSSSAACNAAAPGWEGNDAYPGYVLNRARPVGERDHRRLRGSAGRRGAAEPAHLAREDHRPPRGRGAGHTEGRGGEHLGHRAHPAGCRRRRGGAC